MSQTKVKFTEVTMKHEISVDMTRALICGGFENGYSPWLRSIEGYGFAPHLSKADFKEGGQYFTPDWQGLVYSIPFVEGCYVELLVDEPEKEEDTRLVRLDREMLLRGWRVLAEKHEKHLRDVLNENDDAGTADTFLQCCIYGEEIYC